MNEQNFTLHNGVVVSNDYARQRIVSYLRTFKISLVERQRIAQAVTNDPWYHGLLVSYLCKEAASGWAEGRFDNLTEEQIPPWPKGHSAKVIKHGLPYLTKGQVVGVRSDEGDYLWVWAGHLWQPVHKSNLIPVPNSLEKSPDEIEDGLEPEQALVGALIDEGFILERVTTHEQAQDWISFYQGHLGEQFSILYKEVDFEANVDLYFVDTPWPTTVTVATAL